MDYNTVLIFQLTDIFLPRNPQKFKIPRNGLPNKIQEDANQWIVNLL